MTPKMATWKFRSEIPEPEAERGSTQAGCFAKGPNKNIQNWHDFLKDKKNPPGLGLYVWPDGVMMSSCPSCPTSCYMSK